MLKNEPICVMPDIDLDFVDGLSNFKMLMTDMRNVYQDQVDNGKSTLRIPNT